MIEQDIERMLFCDVCGDEAVMGFGLAVEGIRMGDYGGWRCAEHHPHRCQSYTKQQWANARAGGLAYPEDAPAMDDGWMREDVA